MEQTGRNESEPHQMSLETSITGDKPSPYPWGEGRREQAGKQSEPVQRSGGVCADSTGESRSRDLSSPLFYLGMVRNGSEWFGFTLAVRLRGAANAAPVFNLYPA